MGIAVNPATCNVFSLHSLLNSGNMSYFDLAVIEYQHFLDHASKEELSNTAAWHPYWTVDYFRRRLWDAHTALLDNVITSADLDEVSPILDEINEELDMIAIWEELVDEFIIGDCDFDNFTSNLASYYEDVEA